MSCQRLALACLLIGLWAAAPSWADDAASIRDVRIGIDGHFKHGKWAEVRVSVQAGSAALQGELQIVSLDGDGIPAAFVCPQPVNLAPGKDQEFSTLVKMGPPRSGLRLRVVDGNQTLVETEIADRALDRAHRSTADVIASLGPSPGTESAVVLLRRFYSDDAIAAPLANASDLPSTHLAYDAIDCLIVAVSDENPLLGAANEQREALLEWLRFGGRLVVVGGESMEEMFRSDSGWSQILPGKITGRTPLRSDAELRSLTGESLDLENVADPPQVFQLQASRSIKMLADAGAPSDQAIVAESPFGMGRVSIVLVDITQPPFTDWPGRPRLLARVIAGEAISLDQRRSSSAGGRMTHLGYRDLSGQLRAALDQYAGVAPVHFYTVAGALVIYLLLLGPGEYFLLRKTAPLAMHLTWLLFPLLVIAFTAAAIWLGRSSRGDRIRINQLELVDLDVNGGRQRGTWWTGMFSPEAASYSLAAQPSLPVAGGQIAQTEFAWQALPGDGLGGVDNEPMTSVFQQPYIVRSGEADSPASIDRLPLALASSKMLSGQWWGTIPEAADASQLRRGKIRDLEGSLRSLAPVPLKDAYLAYGEWLYRARGEIVSGSTIDIDQLERRHLEYHLTRRRVLESSDFATPWNQEETDVARILEIMVFHEAVRGRNYTVLSHRYAAELDLSHLIRRGYAVLIGRAETPLVDLKISDERIAETDVRRWTYYRIIYPVAAPQE